MKTVFYFLSIKELEERRSHILRLCERLRQLGHECEIIDAFFWKTCDVMAEMTALGLTWGDFNPYAAKFSQAQLGCFLSHHKAWRLISQSERSDCLHVIVEDDMDITPLFETKWNDMSDHKEVHHADAVVWWKHPHQAHLQEKHRIDESFSAFYEQWGLCAYSITPTFAKTLVEKVQTVGGPVDTFVISKIFPDYTVRIAVPELFRNLGDLGTGRNQHQVFGSSIWFYP